MDRGRALTWARATVGLLTIVWLGVLLAMLYTPYLLSRHRGELWDPSPGQLLLMYLAFLLRRSLPVIGPLLLVATVAALFWWVGQKKARGGSTGR